MHNGYGGGEGGKQGKNYMREKTNQFANSIINYYNLIEIYPGM